MPGSEYDSDYEVGYRDGESSVSADYHIALTEAFDDIEDTSPQAIVRYIQELRSSLE